MTERTAMGGDSRKPKKTGDGPPCRTLQIYLAMQVCVRGRPAPPGEKPGARSPTRAASAPSDPRAQGCQTRGRRAAAALAVGEHDFAPPCILLFSSFTFGVFVSS